MFRELGSPADDDWADRGQIRIDKHVRSWIKEEAGPRLEWWEQDRTGWENSILRLGPEAKFHLSAISLMSAMRLRLDRELLLLVGQAEELEITWTALAEALTTSPQNAHKVFAKRLMSVREWVANGWTVAQAIDEFYRRKGG